MVANKIIKEFQSKNINVFNFGYDLENKVAKYKIYEFNFVEVNYKCDNINNNKVVVSVEVFFRDEVEKTTFSIPLQIRVECNLHDDDTFDVEIYCPQHDLDFKVLFYTSTDQFVKAIEDCIISK